MSELSRCPECRAAIKNGEPCRSYFDQMLFWEAEYPDYGTAVHHLAVLCYHLQHPSLYSPEGLAMGKELLLDFLEKAVAPAEARRRNRGQVASGKRNWKITGHPGAIDRYAHPITWALTAADVVADGHLQYVQNVRSWAAAMLTDLRQSDNLKPHISANNRVAPGTFTPVRNRIRQAQENHFNAPCL